MTSRIGSKSSREISTDMSASVHECLRSTGLCAPYSRLLRNSLLGGRPPSGYSRTADSPGNCGCSVFARTRYKCRKMPARSRQFRSKPSDQQNALCRIANPTDAGNPESQLVEDLPTPRRSGVRGEFTLLRSCIFGEDRVVPSRSDAGKQS
jgi:hypothetical protein